MRPFSSVSVHLADEATVTVDPFGGGTVFHRLTIEGADVHFLGTAAELRVLASAIAKAVDELTPRDCLHGDYHRPGECPEANALPYEDYHEALYGPKDVPAFEDDALAKPVSL